MPGLFLSHSSKDKSMILGLAADLVNNGFPVWLDSWEIELGDSLFARVFDGIDRSTFVLLALSSNSMSSPWVARELKAAIAKERKLGRKVVLPLKIADCAPPRAIADRLYADFTTGYRAALDTLLASLRSIGALEIQVPFERELLPLKLTKGIYLDEVSAQKRFEQLLPALRQGASLTAGQILPVPTREYQALRALLLSTLDTFAEHPSYSPRLEFWLNQTFEVIKRGEDGLRAGIAELANGIVRVNDWAFFSEAAHWLIRILMNELLARLNAVRLFVGEETLGPSVEPIADALTSSATAARFLEVEDVFPCDVFNDSSGDYIRVWVDSAGEVGRWFERAPQLHRSMREFATPRLMYKFVIPQMLASHFFFSESTPVVWDFSELRIGAV